MEITVNGEIKRLDEEVSVHRLLELLSLPPRRIAIELNRQVIRKQDWETTLIRPDDKIEIVHFVGGG